MQEEIVITSPTPPHQDTDSNFKMEVNDDDTIEEEYIYKEELSEQGKETKCILIDKQVMFYFITIRNLYLH